MKHDFMSPAMKRQMLADCMDPNAAINQNIADWNAMVTRLRDEDAAKVLSLPLPVNNVKPVDGDG